MVETVDPRTGLGLERFAFDAPGEVEAALGRAEASFLVWRRSSWVERRAGLDRLAGLLRAQRRDLAALISSEMGKIETEALAEVDKSAAALDLFGAEFPRWRAAREADLGGGFSTVLRPLGPTLGIMPWNFPLWQVVRFAVPAILCGNVVLLKHASGVWGFARRLAELFDISFPRGTYQNLQLTNEATEALISDPRVRGVSLTGSVRAGRRVGELAGRALKTCVLELGGSDAYVILDDADLDPAARVSARSRLLNAGQSCVSAKRFIVTARNHDAFLERLVGEMRGAEIAPLARGDLREQLVAQVDRSVAAGASKALGGGPRAGAGFFFEPTVLSEVRPGQPAFDEELFGPVAAVIRAADEAEAMQLANQSTFGLGGAIFSRDVARARALAAEELDCGMAFVNQMVRSEAAVPFGGIKDSGVGRELGRDGAFAFTNLKVVFS